MNVDFRSKSPRKQCNNVLKMDVPPWGLFLPVFATIAPSFRRLLHKNEILPINSNRIFRSSRPTYGLIVEL